MERRTFLIGAAAATAIASPVLAVEGKPALFGLIGRMKATPGQRDALIAILLEGTTGMAGCLSYIVARDTEDADGIWITEVWESEASHDAALQLPAVQAAIDKGRPLIADVDTGHVTAPVGGVGLKG